MIYHKRENIPTGLALSRGTGKKDKNPILLKSSDSFWVYVFMIKGEALIAGEKLKRRDDMGISKAKTFEIPAETDARILLIEVPEHLYL